MPTRSKEANRRRKEEEAMAQATLEREKEAASQQLQEEAEKAAVSVGLLPLPVVSPPSASNLTSLLTGHVGQDADGSKTEEEPVLDVMDDDARVETGKPKKQKKTKKTKPNKDVKDNVAVKKNRRSLVVKQGSVAVPPSTPCPPDQAYKYKRVFNEAGLELKGEDKYGAYVKQIGNLLKNIQLVDPTAILHAAVESDDTKPIGKKEIE
jgi:hypothetical protein